MLCHGIVVVDAGGPRGADSAGLDRPLGVPDGEVLASLVQVRNDAGCVLAGVGCRSTEPTSRASRARSVHNLFAASNPRRGARVSSSRIRRIVVRGPLARLVPDKP